MLREVFLNPMIISGVEVIEMIGRYHREDRNTIENNKLFIAWVEKFRDKLVQKTQGSNELCKGLPAMPNMVYFDDALLFSDFIIILFF